MYKYVYYTTCHFAESPPSKRKVANGKHPLIPWGTRGTAFGNFFFTARVGRCEVESECNRLTMP